MKSAFLSFTTKTGWEDSSRCFFSAAERLWISRLAEQVAVSPPEAVTLQVYWPLSAAVQLDSSRLNRLSFDWTWVGERSSESAVRRWEAGQRRVREVRDSRWLRYLEPVRQGVLEGFVVLQPCGRHSRARAGTRLEFCLLSS